MSEAVGAAAVLPSAPLTVGVGASRGAPAEEILGLVRDALREAGLSPRGVAELATVDSKAEEPGIVAAALALGVPLRTYPAEELARVAVGGRSGAALAAVGTASVAEAAALVAGGELVVPKRKSAPRGRVPMVTCAVARRAPDAAVPFGTAPDPHDLRHHGDAEVRGGELTDLAVNVRAGTPPVW
ncbi:cobalamin biosynthesis protein, partial [Streptomyces sp. NPDC001274]